MVKSMAEIGGNAAQSRERVLDEKMGDMILGKMFGVSGEKDDMVMGKMVGKVGENARVETGRMFGMSEEKVDTETEKMVGSIGEKDDTVIGKTPSMSEEKEVQDKQKDSDGKMQDPAEKAVSSKHLWIFLAVCFGLTWLFFGICIAAGHRWDATEENAGSLQLLSLGMLFPAIAVLITRRITKEGYAFTGKGSMKLGIRFQDKKWIWFLAAALLPWLFFELGAGCYLLLMQGAFDASNPERMGLTDYRLLGLMPVNSIINGIFLSVLAYGEEAGWRGYMMPKMIKAWGMKKAVLIGGIVWGIWHWPLTVIGHDFGTDYWGYPYIGMIEICILCIGMNALFTYVSLRTDSVWAAVIFHASLNSNPGILRFFIGAEGLAEWQQQGTVVNGILSLPAILFGIVFFIRMLRKEKELAEKL